MAVPTSEEISMKVELPPTSVPKWEDTQPLSAPWISGIRATVLWTCPSSWTMLSKPLQSCLLYLDRCFERLWLTVEKTFFWCQEGSIELLEELVITLLSLQMRLWSGMRTWRLWKEIYHIPFIMSLCKKELIPLDYFMMFCQSRPSIMKCLALGTLYRFRCCYIHFRGEA